MKYGEFTYHSEPEDGDDVTKMMHYVFCNQEYIGMLPVSPYKNASFEEFKEYCEKWTRPQKTSEAL